MNHATNKSSLPEPEARLVELLQKVNFGRVEALKVTSGQPSFDPPPRIIQKFKIGSDNSARPELGHADFRLKHGVLELLNIIHILREGEIRSIEVRFGLPVALEVEWSDSPGTLQEVAATRDQRGAR